MGRIPKLVKEKALAESVSTKSENCDPPQLSTTNGTAEILSNSSIVDLRIPLIDDHILFTDFHHAQLDQSLDCQTPMFSNNESYQLPDNFTLDETRRTSTDEDPRIVQLNRSALTNYMSNCEDLFSTEAIQRVKEIVHVIAHPTTTSQLDYEQSSFIRYLRWKMFDLSNTYNGRTRQLIERMNTMIRLGVNLTRRKKFDRIHVR